MFRMKFRSNPIGIGFLVLGAGLIGTMHLNPIFGGKEFLYDLPLMYIAPAQLAIPFLFAIASYRACPFVQQISAFFITLGLIFLLGLIGNFTTYDPNRLAIFQKTLEIHFNVFQIGIMNIMAMIAALKCMQVEQMSSFADTQVAEAQLGRLKSNKVDPDQQAKWEKAASNADKSHEGRSLRSTMTNLKAISLADPSQELKPTVPASRDERNKAKASEPEDGGSLANLLDRMGDEPAPVAGEEIAQEESLAKSIDSIPEPAAEIKQEQAEDFHPKSVDAPSDSFLSKFLDREEDGDTKQAEIPDIKEEEKSQPISNAGFRMTSQSAKTDAALAKIDAEMPKEEQAPPVKPEPTPAPEPVQAQEAEPAPGSTNNRMQAMKRRNTSTFTKLQSLSASGTGSLLPTPEEKVQETSEEPDSLKSLLDRLDEDKPEVKEAPAVSAAPEKAPLEDAYMLSLDFVFSKKQEAVKEEPAKEESKARPSMSERMHAAEEHKAEPEPEVTKEPEPEIAATPEPEPEPAPEPEPELIPEPELRSEPEVEAAPEPKLDLDEAPLLATSDATGEEPPVGLEEKVENETSVEPAGEEEEEDKGTLFEGGVDNDIDDIFSNLAPPEAQLEVKDLIATKKEEKPPVTEEEEDDDKGVLFEGGVDSDIDDIFSQLAPPEGQREVKDVLPKPSVDKKPADVIKSDTTDEDDNNEGLFDAGLGEDLDNIFSGLTETEQKEVNAETLSKFKSTDEKKAEPVKAEAPKAEAAKPEASKAEAPKADAAKADAKDGPAGAKYKEVKEFGRLSNRSAAQPKTSTESVGTMKTIGKLLLDVHAVENIIKAGETKKLGSGLSTAKVISAARGEGIKNILTSIDTYEGVAGSLIVGHDGLVIASTVGQGWDKDMLGALSTALLSTSNLATKKLEIGKLRQMVLLTELGKGEFKTTVLTDVEVGILAVFIEKTDLSKIDGLLETIHKTIHGG